MSQSLTFHFTTDVEPPWSLKEGTTSSNEAECTPHHQTRGDLPSCVLSTSHLGSFLRQTSSDQTSQTNKIDLLCEALHMMMIDSGFVEQKSTMTQSLTCRYNYIAPIGPMVHVNFVCTNLGPQIVAHASMALPSNSTEVASCTLPIKEYCTQEKDSSVILQNTSQLAQQFKDCVPHKLITDLRRALDLPETGTILCLSHEIKLLIMSMLDLSSLLQLTAVNREFYMLGQDSQLWRRIFMKEFGKGLLELPKNSEIDSWKMLYIEHYHKRKEKRQVLVREMEIFPPRPPLIYPPYHGGGLLPPFSYAPFGRLRPHGDHRQRRFFPYLHHPITHYPEGDLHLPHLFNHPDYY